MINFRPLKRVTTKLIVGKRKLILTHRKDLLIGDVLIDDSRWRGQPDFQGKWIWFGHNQRCRDWPSTLEYIYKYIKT